MLRVAHCAISLSHTHLQRSPALTVCSLTLTRSLNEHKFNGKMAFNCNRQCETFSGQVLPTRFHQATCRRYRANAPQFSLSYGNIAHKATTASCCLLLFHHHQAAYDDHRHLVSLRSCWKMISRCCYYPYTYSNVSSLWFPTWLVFASTGTESACPTDYLTLR